LLGLLAKEMPTNMDSTDTRLMSDSVSRELLRRYAKGEERAVGAICDRYAPRLIALARQRIGRRLRRRVDAEDVVQSAYRSFFRRAGENAFVLQRAGDLWRLLAKITLHKLAGQVERHTAGRRDIGREQDVARSSYAPVTHATSKQPTPDKAAAVAEQLALAVELLQPLERDVLSAHLQGETIRRSAPASGGRPGPCGG
jgi:RNA polymerase sigma-70 factor (ECF subfamily)